MKTTFLNKLFDYIDRRIDQRLSEQQGMIADSEASRLSHARYNMINTYCSDAVGGGWKPEPYNRYRTTYQTMFVDKK